MKEERALLVVVFGLSLLSVGLLLGDRNTHRELDRRLATVEEDAGRCSSKMARYEQWMKDHQSQIMQSREFPEWRGK